MYYDQCFTRSHWMPPSGDYLLRITPAAARVTANKTKVQNVSTLLTNLMAIVVRRYYTARITRWRRFMAFINATKRLYQVSTCSDIIKRDITMLQIHYLLRFSGAGDGVIEFDG
jgi:hypothetical protein